MTQKDKIQAEIERLYKEYMINFFKYGDAYRLALYDGLEIAKKIIDSLPDEYEDAVEGEAEELYYEGGEIHCVVAVGTHFKPGDKVKVIKI